MIENSELARRLPPPIPGVKISIPLNLWPAYMKLHKLEPHQYIEQDEILIVKSIPEKDVES